MHTKEMSCHKPPAISIKRLEATIHTSSSRASQGLIVTTIMISIVIIIIINIINIIIVIINITTVIKIERNT